MALEEAKIKEREGYDVFFVLCDKSVGVCHPNSYCSKQMCIFCKYTMMKLIKPLLSNSHYHCVSISSLITEHDKEIIQNIKFDYSTVEELKSIEFHGVEVGYGAFSNYVSSSRNIMPDFTPEFHEYIDYIIRSEVLMTICLERYINKINPNLMIFHNGRFSNVKAMLWLSKINKIDYIATETYSSKNGVMMKNNSHNDIPHSQKAQREKIELAWEHCGAIEGTNIGKTFFLNKKMSKPAGDKVYTKDQKMGKLPADFDAKKRNISIFNSSEDEMFSISREYDNTVLFPNQFIALKTIFDHYKDDKTVHFYLRIHPNLATVPYKSHTLLYELKYENVTIIPPKSDISSYALMDSSEKVIVFNSTMGVESSYWGKAVIALGKDFYTSYNIVHQPKTIEQVYEMIDNPKLECLRDETSCYKLACYQMGYGTDDFIYYKVTSKLENFCGRPINTYSCFKFFNSEKIHRLIELTLMGLALLNPKCRMYYRLASN